MPGSISASRTCSSASCSPTCRGAGFPAGEYELIAPNAGYFAFGLERFLSPGAKTLSFDYATAFGGPAPAIESSKGDVAWLVQHDKGTLTGGGAFSVLRRAGQLSPLAARAGAVAASTALLPLPEETFEWDRSGWEAIRAE